MALRPIDDMVHLEEIAPTEASPVFLLNRDPNEKKRARVLAVGPKADQVKPGDVVIAHAGAGFKFTHEGKEQWFVYGSRGDIIAVVENE